MPLDAVLPPANLPPLASADRIVEHFPARFGVRVDVDDLDSLPRQIRLSRASVRIPEPPEAVLLDRTLQVVPAVAARLIERVLIVDAGITGQLGAYASGVIRLGTDALRLRAPDRQFAGKLSVFSSTVLHEIGHAVHHHLLTPAQRFTAEDVYLAFLEGEEGGEAEASADGAEHHFVALFAAGLARIGYGPYGPAGVRELLEDLGVQVR